MIKEIIKPETELEKRIIEDPAFIEGAYWGKPRKGHPEGQVIYHIGHVLENVDKYATTENREKLRLIAILHDTFKYQQDRSKSASRENNHSMIARRFAEKFISDLEILEIIELHDVAYYAWCSGFKDHNMEKAENISQRLINRLGQSMPLFLAFYQCDNETGDKTNDDFLWFREVVNRL